MKFQCQFIKLLTTQNLFLIHQLLYTHLFPISSIANKNNKILAPLSSFIVPLFVLIYKYIYILFYETPLFSNIWFKQRFCTNKKYKLLSPNLNCMWKEDYPNEISMVVVMKVSFREVLTRHFHSQTSGFVSIFWYCLLILIFFPFICFVCIID